MIYNIKNEKICPENFKDQESYELFIKINRSLIIKNDLIIVKNCESIAKMLLLEMDKYKNLYDIEPNNILNTIFSFEKLFFHRYDQENFIFTKILIKKLNLEIIEFNKSASCSGINYYFKCKSKSKPEILLKFKEKTNIIDFSGFVYVSECVKGLKNYQINISKETPPKPSCVIWNVENYWQFEANLRKILYQFKTSTKSKAKFTSGKPKTAMCEEFFNISPNLIKLVGDELIELYGSIDCENSKSICDLAIDNHNIVKIVKNKFETEFKLVKSPSRKDTIEERYTKIILDFIKNSGFMIEQSISKLQIDEFYSKLENWNKKHLDYELVIEKMNELGYLTID